VISKSGTKIDHKKREAESGFTMTELSIVIVIIGVIVTMIIYGKDKVDNAKVMSVIRDINNYKSAIDSFKFKYSEYPGDFRSATSYWATCIDGGANTCNGDGDGIIEETGNENGRSWQHMGLADVIDGEFTGDVIDNSTVIGNHLPASNMDNAGYDLVTKTNITKNFNMALTLARVNAFGLKGGAIKAIDANSIDKKIDDGLASGGHVFATAELDGGGSPVTNHCLNFVPTPAQYDLDEEQTNKSAVHLKLCLLHFAIVF